MKFTQLFTKTRKEIPSDEVSKNAQLLIRAGFIFKEMAGVYTLLPLGYKVVEKITAIIKEEMDAVGGVQMKTSAIQSKEVWETTNRWDDAIVDNWFKSQLKNGTEIGFSFTNEEAYSNIMKNFITSYRDLPAYPYDFKTIFRNEARAKSGIMRGREFYWKALYSFSRDEAEHNAFYEKMKETYLNIYKRVGIGDYTYITFASGGTFSKFSHEFQAVSNVGEDTIYIDEEKGFAINDEVYNDEVLSDLGVDKTKTKQETSIEVGNIFTLGFKFSTPFGLTYKDETGSDVPVFMGSYGIGITRLMGTIVELLSDEKGIVWPKSVAPFDVHIVQLGENEEVISKLDELTKTLDDKKITWILDDRKDISAGQKFADSDLMGMPVRIVVSEKSLLAGGVEVKKRTETASSVVSVQDVPSEV